MAVDDFSTFYPRTHRLHPWYLLRFLIISLTRLSLGSLPTQIAVRLGRSVIVVVIVVVVVIVGLKGLRDF